MSLVTRCPACATTFKVVRDQLRISDGWVRCGRCSQVFDANLDLQETQEPTPSPASQDPAASGEGEDEDGEAGDAYPHVESGPASPADAPAGEMDEPDFLDDELDTAPPASSDTTASSTATPAEEQGASEPAAFAGFVVDEPWPEQLMTMHEEAAPVVPPYRSYPPFPKIDLTLPGARPPASAPAPVDHLPERSAEDAAAAQLQKALRRARAKSAKIAKAQKARELKAAVAGRDSAPVVLAASEPDPGVDVARRSMPSAPASLVDKAAVLWRRVSTRRGLIVAAVLAGALLILQILHQQRDLIVARQPGLRPMFAALCGLTGCQLSALRQIASITIEGASFSREKTGDAYRLSFTLRNSAAVPLAMPSIELSLLDTQERAVVRRILMPGEFGAPATLVARGERAASMPVALTGPEAAALPPIAGFRIEALYP